MTPRQEMRVLVGLLVQPLVAGVAAFLFFPVLDALNRTSGRYSGGSGWVQAGGSVAFGAGMVAVFVVVFGALPAIAWVGRRRPATLRVSLLAGALLGNLPAATIAVLATINGGWAAPWPGR